MLLPERVSLRAAQRGDGGWFLTALPAPCRPGWLKQLFTDFISFTLKLVLKSEVGSACRLHAPPLAYSPSAL